MTRTLTTEQLRARAESLGLDFFIERRAGIWVKEWFNDGCTSATDEEVMMWSMLANREAQPVALVDRRPSASGSICWHNGGKSLPHGTELYTAPPAPAVPNGFKLMPLEMTDEIGEAIAMEARCCGGIALCIYEAALAAAPGDENDHDTRR